MRKGTAIERIVFFRTSCPDDTQEPKTGQEFNGLLDADTSYINIYLWYLVLGRAGHKKSLASASTTSRQRRLWPCWEIKGETRRPDGVSLLCVGPISRERRTDGRAKKRKEKKRGLVVVLFVCLSLYRATIVEDGLPSLV